MEPAQKKSKNTSLQELWVLNSCMICSKSLDSTSKLLKCLHIVCIECIKFKISSPGYFQCKCGWITEISNNLISNTLGIFKNNHVGQNYQKHAYGKFITKSPCPVCVCNIIEVYCTKCRELHCGLCHLLNHRTHEFKSIDKVMEEIRSNLVTNKVDLHNKSDFLHQSKLYLSSSINKLKTQKCEIIKEVHKQFEEMRTELFRSENKMTVYIETFYKGAIEKIHTSTWEMTELKKKCDYYIFFSETILNEGNKADIDITNLINNQLANVRKDVAKEIAMEKTNENIDLKVKFNETLHQLIDCEPIKTITVQNPHKYVEPIDAIMKTGDITLCPGYDDVSRIFDIPPPIVDEIQMNKIIEYNCARLERKAKKKLDSSADIGSYSSTNASNKIQQGNYQYLQNQPEKIVSNNQINNTMQLRQRKSSKNQVNMVAKQRKEE